MRDGVLRSDERLAARIARATVPKVGVVIRKEYGGGHYPMGGQPTKPDFPFCWPTAELGFMALEPGVATVYRRRLDAMEPEKRDEERHRLMADGLTNRSPGRRLPTSKSTT